MLLRSELEDGTHKLTLCMRRDLAGLGLRRHHGMTQNRVFSQTGTTIRPSSLPRASQPQRERGLGSAGACAVKGAGDRRHQKSLELLSRDLLT